MKRILIANRGEIALRIMRTCKEMGIETIAVYSEADRHSPHVKYADYAACIGPAPSAQSYLQMDTILETAIRLKADGIHPGYGFLSENAEFAQKVTDAGLIFIGPSPHAIRMMGSKIEAKKAAKKFHVPLVPGTENAITSVEEARKIALEIGFPVLIKASAGGGGKGMRIVYAIEELEEQMNRAISEATSAFGDGSVFIEKYITKPKHIEIQILADQHGNTVYLFERECTIQRRHQKVIEEAPSVAISPETRHRMGECAVNVARSCQYTGAGTVEFIYDETGQFYFLEMNTRLQVEHPVTEMITGIDLVREQIKIARGEKLSFCQQNLSINGHAIEVRVYAEDPANRFLPDIGKLIKYVPPKGPGIRVDDGLEEGMNIPVYYDPMIAKLIVHAPDRPSAIQKMIQAISDYKIIGVHTTLDFCKYVLQHEEFKNGKFDTHFVEKHFLPEHLSACDAETELHGAVFAAWLYHNKSSLKKTTSTSLQKKITQQSAWKKRRGY